jgi:hypothetical protein
MKAKRNARLLLIAVSLGAGAAIVAAAARIYPPPPAAQAARAPASVDRAPVQIDYLPSHFVEEERSARIEPLPPQF